MKFLHRMLAFVISPESAREGVEQMLAKCEEELGKRPDTVLVAPDCPLVVQLELHKHGVKRQNSDLCWDGQVVMVEKSTETEL